jgi:hypothetical protein
MTSQPDSTERRAAPRLKTHPDDHVIINNVRFPLGDWSRVGLLFGPMGNPPVVGQRLDLKVAVLIRGDRVRFTAMGEVLRVHNGQVAVRYECQSPEALPRLSSYFDSAK